MLGRMASLCDAPVHSNTQPTINDDAMYATQNQHSKKEVALRHFELITSQCYDHRVSNSIDD